MYEMNKIDRLKQTLIMHKDEIFQKWKSTITGSFFSFDETIDSSMNQAIEFLFHYFITDQIDTEEQTHLLENIIREQHIIKPDCISAQYINRIHVEEIFFDIVHKYHPEPLTWEEICWVQNFFKKFMCVFISTVEHIKDEISTKQIQKLKDEKMHSIQLLEKVSATFVHEFRNPLTVVLGFLQLLKKDYPELPYMNVIHSELEQLNDRITQFLAISKKEAVAPIYETIEPAKFCEELTDFLSRTISEQGIQLETSFQIGQKLRVDPSKLRQILLNIFFNAVEALAEQENRKIRFVYKMENERHIFLIANNGPKISKLIMDKIFQPFMSTKELGTGIGLYISQKVIAELHGEINFTSNDTETIFYIFLPIQN